MRQNAKTTNPITIEEGNKGTYLSSLVKTDGDAENDLGTISSSQHFAILKKRKSNVLSSKIAKLKTH